VFGYQIKPITEERSHPRVAEALAEAQVT